MIKDLPGLSATRQTAARAWLIGQEETGGDGRRVTRVAELLCEIQHGPIMLEEQEWEEQQAQKEPGGDT